MKRGKQILMDASFTLLMVLGAFLINVVMTRFLGPENTMESVFVLGVFIVSLRTQERFWGIAASFVSVLAVNFAFTYPYWAFDLISPECISAAVAMFIVAIMTTTLTARLKQQEKVKAETERERMRGNLLRAVSHDLRTPLTSIYGACSVMLENYDEMPRQTHLKLLKDIRNDAQWLVRMVENLLSITRAEGEHVRLKKTSTVLEELIDAVLVKFKKRYPEQKVILALPEEFISIPMDAMLIEQVLMNLLENAVFHAKDMTRLILRVEAQDHKAIFSVEDNGCGIPPERMKTIFNGMQEQSSPRDVGRSSMGIGLSVCSAIIKAHGGDITAHNSPTGGAVFRFSLEMEDNYGEQ